MSILPYGQSDTPNWLLAGSGSLVTHVAVGALLLGGLHPFLTGPGVAPDQPRYSVTLQPLDSDTLAGLELREGMAGAEAVTESSTPEQLAALEGEAERLSPEESEMEKLAALTPAPTEALPVEALPPVIADPVSPEAEPSATDATTLPPEEVPTSPTAPLPPLIPEDTSPLSPETVTALASSTGDQVAVAPITSGAAVAAPVVTSQIASVEPVAALPSPVSGATDPGRSTGSTTARPPASAQDLAVGDLIRKIRSNAGEECLLTLPRSDGEDGVGLDMMAAQDTAFSRFSETVLTQSDSDLRQTRTLLDPRQCPAVEYIKDNRDYPATRLGLRLDASSVASGTRLTGVLRGTAGKYVALLLVDNNGVVQDLQRFLSQSGNFTRFDVPVTRSGPRRDTAQMLIAIASRSPMQQIRDRNGRLAEDVFAGLQGSLSGQAALAITTFDVR